MDLRLAIAHSAYVCARQGFDPFWTGPFDAEVDAAEEGAVLHGPFEDPGVNCREWDPPMRPVSPTPAMQVSWGGM